MSTSLRSLATRSVGEGFMINVVDADLRSMQANGLHRYGVVTACFAKEIGGKILMLEHGGYEEKVDDGAYGPLGETSKVLPGEAGLLVEPTIATVLRSQREELGVTLQVQDMAISAIQPIVPLDWPVGYRFRNDNTKQGTALLQMGGALCPVVVLSDSAIDRVMAAAPTKEIKSKRLMSLEEARVLKNIRPGTLAWLEHIAVYSMMFSGSPMVTPKFESWPGSKSPHVVDAIFKDIYNTVPEHGPAHT